MQIELTPLEARLIGCLIEKEVTTPDQYPLSLNALMMACNQKSNRDPVMALDESTVQQTLDELAKKHLLSEASGFGSRVVKYKHRFCNTEFSELQFSAQERAILCVLLLRGPQTPGELRTRTNRLCKFDDVKQTEQALEALASRAEPLVVKLPREAGKRDSRYAHLLSGEVDVASLETASAPVASAASHQVERIEQLEQAVAELRQEMEQLKARINASQESQ